MSKDKGSDKERLDHTDAGGHLGGTHFGQQPGEAKEDNGQRGSKSGDKARPNDGSN